MIKYILAFLVLVCAMTVGADSAVNVHGFSAADSDPSIGFLGQIFGSVGNVLHGSSGQMLGQIFGKLNEAFVVLAGLWLFYTTITVVLRSATEGSFLGQNKNTLFIFVRVALGIGLLLPMPSGYSVFQQGVMFVVKQGIGLADQAWSTVLDYVGSGGVTYTPPRPNEVTNANAVPWVQAATRNAVCMAYQSYKQPTTKNDVPGSGAFIDTANTPPQTLNYIVDADHQTINFPSSPTNPTGCGSIHWTAPDASAAPGDPSNKIGDYQRATALQVLSDVMSPARDFAHCLADPKTACSAPGAFDMQQQMLGKAMAGAAMDYANLMLPVARMQADENYKNKAGHIANFVKNAKDSGWVLAGRYYWDMVATIPSDTGSDSAQNPAFPPPQAATVTPDDTSKYFDPSRTESGGITAAITQTLQTNYQQASAGNNALDSMQDLSDSISSSNAGKGTGALKVIMGGLLGGFGALITDMFGVQSNPIIWLHNIGQDCLSVFLDVWIGGAFAIAGIMPLFVCGAINPINDTVSMISAWLKPAVFGLAGILAVAGVMVGYYLPLYPYFVFTLGVIGWLITVVESMVAAPLICLGLTHPDGHDFLGKAEQAVMLLLSVFLRPVLMVLGLVAAMVMMFVVLRVINAGFSGILLSVMQGLGSEAGTGWSGNQVGDAALSAALAQQALLMANSAGGAAYGLNAVLFWAVKSAMSFIILLPVFLLMYALFLYEIVNHIFSLIYILPDRIMRWIGMPNEQSETSSLIYQLKGGISQPVSSSINMHQMLESQRGVDEEMKNRKGSTQTATLGGGTDGVSQAAKKAAKKAGIGGQAAEKNGSEGGLEMTPMGSSRDTD